MNTLDPSASMKTQYYGASSLDGYIADENHSLEWLFQFDSLENTSYPEFIRDVGAIAMGSATYEWVLRHHVYADALNPQPWPYEQPSWVFSSRALTILPDADIRFAEGDVAMVHPEMVDAARGKNIWVVGGGDLAGQFHDAGLLDELIIQITSVTLGRGAPVLPRRITEPPLRLLSCEKWGDGFAELRYEVGRS